ncbi:MAG: aromatic ring-hydroxylating dioxygenase subunit alpha, partial [Alphaproteobacteria bacterium]
PNAHYVDPEVHRIEIERLIFDQWAGVAVGADVPEPGDAMPVTFCGVPLLVVRDREGRVRVFQNTCRHRGMILVSEKRNLRGTIVCPYHAWCYNLDGSLRATPHAGGPGRNTDPSLDRATLGLVEFPSALWRDVVFVNISGTAPPFETFIAPLAARWHEHEGKPLFHGGPDSRFGFELKANWKLAIENYCESYHLPWVHPGLNSYSRLEDHYHIEAPGHFSGQGTRVYRQFEGEGGERFPDVPGLGPFWNLGAEYVALFPNVLFAAQRDHGYAILVLPEAVDRTRERVEIYYAFDPAERPDLAEMIRRNTRQWYQVLWEDVFVVEGMQAGRHGPRFDGGKFAPVMDSPTWVFHAWVAGQLLAGPGGAHAATAAE